MPLFSTNWWNNRDPAFTSAAGATVAVLFAILAVYKQQKRIAAGQHQPGTKEIPTPKQQYPFFGHLLSLGPMVSQQITKWHNELGSDIIQVNMGIQKWIMLNDPKLAHDIFVTNGAVASSRPFMAFTYMKYAMGGKGVVFTDAGKSWRNTRKAVLTVLAPKMVDKFRDVIEREVDYLVDNLASNSDPIKGLNPVKYLQLASLNLILTTMFGKRAKTIDDELFTHLVKYVEDSVAYGSPANDIGTFVPAMKFLDLFTGSKKRLEGERLLSLRANSFKKLIMEAKNSSEKSFIKTLYEIKDEHDLDDDDIMVTMSDITIAGTDTTSVSLAWALVILVNRPHIQKKMHEELDAFVAEHKRVPTFDDRSSLPYLAAVQRECMRFRNITHFGMSHIADEDIISHGYVIPKGAIVMCNMNGIHMNPNVFENPEEFIPERFMNIKSTMYAAANGRLENRDHYQFGWGRRVCPGIYLSEVEMFAALIQIFASYSVEPPLNEKGEPVYPDDTKAVDSGIVVTPAQYNVRIVKRSTVS
ncbi:cytochrome P450 [Phascolomyces articulosus]|uniref:Cytochrome P450 n=1 Tax=Phascolomyces articulosus TaxID=60185 RepID=A0AAD5K905_9FUNG|nr:cytochrome P450 [Phascolomyces articulosus]